MSTTTSDTSAIDNKKQEENSSSDSANLASNIVSFIISIITIFIVVLIYFSSSGLILFVCKVAQSNILPTEENCYPYTENKPVIQPIKTNIFTTFTDPEMSMKLEFPYDDFNSSNKAIDMFRKYKNKPSSHFLANYFIYIIEHLMLFNYSAINTIMNSLNCIPEILIVGLGPIIVGFLFSIMSIINVLYMIYLWFSGMSWFFKTNTNDSGDGLPKWEDVTMLSPLNWGLGLGLVILFAILFFFGFAFISSIPFAILSYCCLICLMYKGIMNDKKISTFTVIKEVLKYYKLTIVGIISFFVIALAFSKLGILPGIFSIITLGLIYWGIISINIFKPITETNLSPSVSYEQATKKCSAAKSKENKHGFLYNLLIGQKGGDITKELKKINKNLNNN
jgi:hypothetical protein